MLVKFTINPGSFSLLRGLFLRESVGRGGATGFTTNGFATDAAWCTWCDSSQPRIRQIKVQIGRTSCLLLMLILRILTKFAVLSWNSQHLQKSLQGLPKTLQGNIIHGFLSSFPWKIWLRDWLSQFDSPKLVISLRMENLLQKYILYKYIHAHRIHGDGIYAKLGVYWRDPCYHI
jgi:hypothetical protein